MVGWFVDTLVGCDARLENSVDRSSGSRDCVYATAKPTIETTVNYRENECHCVAEHGSRNKDGGCLVAVRITPRLTPPRRIASQDISYELLLGITAIFFRGACFSRKTCSWLFVTHAAAGNLSMYTEGEARDYPHPSRGFYMPVADSHDATD